MKEEFFERYDKQQVVQEILVRSNRQNKYLRNLREIKKETFYNEEFDPGSG